MTKKLLISALLGIILTATFAMTASAAGSSKTDAFDGTFSGTVTGDKRSKTTLTLDLDQNSREVDGTVTLGSGLRVNAGGFCGIVAVPAVTFDTGATLASRNSRHLVTAAKVNVGNGIVVTIEFDGILSADNETLDITATIDTPFLCGRDPVITGTLNAM
jgi:hypothetical protein